MLRVQWIFLVLFVAGCSGGLESDSGSNSSLPGSGGPPQNSPDNNQSGVPGISPPQSQGDLDSSIDEPPPVDPADMSIDNEATSFFFSYDESASTASRDLSLASIANGRRPDPFLGRAFEFLNAETFDHFDSRAADIFTVSMGLLVAEEGDVPVNREVDGRLYALGVNLTGPVLSRDARPNVVLTLLLDVSGSMDTSYADETRQDIRSLLEVAKFGIGKMQATLKPGDVINLVTFSTEARLVVEGSNGIDDAFLQTLAGIGLEASTNINAGVELAYQVANRTFDPVKANRVILLTDALVNTGELDPAVIARNTVINGLEGIYFAGIGIGSDFNDAVLNTVTDIGSGPYSAMITPVDAERIFTSGFNRFIEPAASDVRFKLTYPQQLNQFLSAAEEVSENAEDIQPVNFSYDSQQFFLELFSGPRELDLARTITLDIEFENGDGEMKTARVSQTIGELLGEGANEITAAIAVSTLAQLIAGALDCETVLASRLFTDPISNDVYSVYRQNIERFCAL